MKLYKSTIL